MLPSIEILNDQALSEISSISDILTSVDGLLSTCNPLLTIRQQLTMLFFQGDSGVNATLMGLTPNGTEYAICTTLQYYGYKPAAAAATLTVEPQSTLLLTTNKTPEQLQAEAENSGWLTIWHEWSWWPPWYRLHVKINIGNTTIDIGFNPILPGGETWNWQGLEIFAGVLEEIWQDIILDFMGVFISYTLAKGLSIWNLVAGLIAEGIKGASIDR